MLLGANTVKAKLEGARAAREARRRHDHPSRRGGGLNDDEVGALLRARAAQAAHPLARAAHADVHRPGRRRLPAHGAHHHPRSAPTASRRRPAAASPGRTSCPRRWRTRTATRSATCSCLDGGGYVPFTRLMSRAKLFELLRGLALHRAAREAGDASSATSSTTCGPNPDRVAESAAVLRDDQAAAQRDVPRRSARCRSSSARRSPSATVKAIYIHSHMDEENFDVAAGHEVLRSACPRQTAATSRPARTTCSTARRTSASPTRRCSHADDAPEARRAERADRAEGRSS